jgi:hypothetical protein
MQALQIMDFTQLATQAITATTQYYFNIILKGTDELDSELFEADLQAIATALTQVIQHDAAQALNTLYMQDTDARERCAQCILLLESL